MRVREFMLAAAALSLSAAADAAVLRITDLNTAQIRALDRAKTVVILPGGMLEEHGPYLPAFTDGILSDRLTQELTTALSQKKPDWTTLLFPQVPFGASGYNEMGGHYVFPGTYPVRPSTLRAVYMDLASQLGEQGFKWIFVVHVHGSPMHIGPIDQAGDYFHDTYGGRMINLWGLVPVLGGWGQAMTESMTDAEKKEDGVSLHAGMDEHSLMLHLKPELVAPGYKNAAAVTGATMQESFDIAKPAGWPGYIGRDWRLRRSVKKSGDGFLQPLSITCCGSWTVRIRRSSSDMPICCRKIPCIRRGSKKRAHATSSSAPSSASGLGGGNRR